MEHRRYYNWGIPVKSGAREADEDDKDEMATAAETFCMRFNFEQCGNKQLIKML